MTKRKKNILYIEANAELAGPQYCLLDLIDHLDKKRFQPIVLLNTDGPLVQLLTSRGISVKVIRVIFPFSKMFSPSAFRHNWKAWSETIKFINTHKVDIIHCQSALSLKILLPSLYRYRARIVQQCDDLYNASSLSFKVCMIFGANTLVAVCNAVHEKAISGIPTLRKRAVRIYNSVNIDTFRPSKKTVRLRKEWGVPKSSTLIGLVANFAPVKDHVTFLKAVRLLQQDTMRTHFLLVGGVFQPDLYPDHVTYKSLVESYIVSNGLSDRVLLTGHRDDMADVFRSLDILVISSITEGCNRAILESMASGTPVIATNSGGTPELIEHERTGLLFEPRDARGLAKSIRRLSNDKKLYTRLRRNALEEVRKRFRPDTRARKFEDKYLEVLSRISPSTSTVENVASGKQLQELRAQ
ncbi:MAG TPA: glycosyltransferase [Bacteroidota bacterium]